MSYYTAICMACGDKAFIQPGWEMALHPKHAGSGYEGDGSQAADAARRDGDHRPVPLAIGTEVAQWHMLNRAVELLRKLVPAGVTATLETTDQEDYGFNLIGVFDAAGIDLLPEWDDIDHPLAGVRDLVWDQICDLNWDGVVGEDRGGHATINLRDVTSDC